MWPVNVVTVGITQLAKVNPVPSKARPALTAAPLLSLIASTLTFGYVEAPTVTAVSSHSCTLTWNPVGSACDCVSPSLTIAAADAGPDAEPAYIAS